jgi:hypothetical protein
MNSIEGRDARNLATLSNPDKYARDYFSVVHRAFAYSRRLSAYYPSPSFEILILIQLLPSTR